MGSNLSNLLWLLSIFLTAGWTPFRDLEVGSKLKGLDPRILGCISFLWNSFIVQRWDIYLPPQSLCICSLYLGSLACRCNKFIKNYIFGAPGWLSRLSVQLRLRSWSHGLWVRAPRLALWWQLGFCVSLSLCPSLACTQSLSLKNKQTLKKIKKK